MYIEFRDITEEIRNSIRYKIGIHNPYEYANMLKLTLERIPIKTVNNINPTLIRMVFESIDKVYLDGFFATNFKNKFEFLTSNRLRTSAANIELKPDNSKFIITVSSAIFDLNFRNSGDIVTVNGIHCGNKLEALVGIIQHEMVHAIEWVNDRRTEHNDKFRQNSYCLFGHREIQHCLKVPGKNHETYLPGRREDFSVGQLVNFSDNGEMFHGRIARIGKRATVMVGPKKWYVPIGLLKKEIN